MVGKGEWGKGEVRGRAGGIAVLPFVSFFSEGSKMHKSFSHGEFDTILHFVYQNSVILNTYSPYLANSEMVWKIF